jgi:hypothetical protein
VVIDDHGASSALEAPILKYRRRIKKYRRWIVAIEAWVKKNHPSARIILASIVAIGRSIATMERSLIRIDHYR